MVSSHIRRPYDEMGRAKRQLLLWIALRAILALSKSIAQLFQIVAQSRAMSGAFHERCRVELSSSGHDDIIIIIIIIILIIIIIIIRQFSMSNYLTFNGNKHRCRSTWVALE